MSSRALTAARPSVRVRVPALLEEHPLTVAAVGLAAGLLLVVAASAGMVGDSWLALVAGREVAEHGLPAHDRLTVVTLGRRWIDQQWLGQLGLYELHRLTRDAFPIVLTCLASIPALLGAAALGRRRSPDRAVALAAFVALLAYVGQAALPRTQSLVYPAFVVLLWLLVRNQSRRTRVAAVAVIALWANLHGSVLLAASVASIRWLQDARSHRARTALLLAATWLATLCSPYAADLPAYYRSTVGNPAFREVLSQWKPLALTGRAAPTWLLVAAVVVLVVRRGWRVWQFEPAVLLVLAALTANSVRGTAFLALAAVALLPGLIEQSGRERVTSGHRVAIAVAALALSALLAAAALTHIRFSPLAPRAAATAASVTGRAKVFVPLELGDWLLWSEPTLRGRVSADARAELLTQAELRRYAGFWKGADGWRSATAGYRSFVLSPTDERWLVRRLAAHSAQFRVAYRDAKLVILVRRVRGRGATASP